MFILGNMFEHHLLCPLLSLFSFMFLEDYKLKLNNIKYPVIITTIYGFILILLNIFKVIDGPYPFLRVYNQTLEPFTDRSNFKNSAVCIYIHGNIPNV